MPHVHADELESWASLARLCRERCLSIQKSLKKLEADLLVIDQQATAAGEPTLLDEIEQESEREKEEVSREI